MSGMSFSIRLYIPHDYIPPRPSPLALALTLSFIFVPTYVYLTLLSILSISQLINHVVDFAPAKLVGRCLFIQEE